MALATSSSRPSVLESYLSFLGEDSGGYPLHVAAIKALTEDIRTSDATTMMGLRDELRLAGEQLKLRPDAPISIASLCELFVRFITRTALDFGDFDSCKSLLIERGEMFAQSAIAARTKIAQLGAPFIQAGGVVLTHGFSRCAVATILAAAKSRHFSVIVAESHPDGDGHVTAHQLVSAGVPVTMIEDTAVAHAMARTQLCICGAEAVVESGGVISKTGTYQMAIVAAACKRPFYIAAESTKCVTHPQSRAANARNIVPAASEAAPLVSPLPRGHSLKPPLLACLTVLVPVIRTSGLSHTQVHANVPALTERLTEA